MIAAVMSHGRMVLELTIVALASACPGGEVVPEHTFASVRDDIFIPRCGVTGCHGGANAVDDLNLAEDAFADLVNVPSAEVAGAIRVVPGDPDNSLLFQVLNGAVAPVEQMPQGTPGGLPDDDIERIRLWIKDGALDN